jgi:voltage-dependent calcium channel alpha-2/delta-3
MLGAELWTAGKYVTRRDEILHKYEGHATVMERSGSGIVQDMAREVKDMMDLKISAVKVCKTPSAFIYVHIYRF